MCDKAILEKGGTLKSVPECYKNQEKCDEVVDNYRHALFLFRNLLEFVLNAIRLKKYVIKLLIPILLKQNMFLNAIRLKKCVIKQFIDIFCI